MENYSDEIFVEKLTSVNFPDNSNPACINDAYQEFDKKFLSQGRRHWEAGDASAPSPFTIFFHDFLFVKSE